MVFLKETEAELSDVDAFGKGLLESHIFYADISTSRARFMDDCLAYLYFACFCFSSVICPVVVCPKIILVTTVKEVFYGITMLVLMFSP